MASDRAMQQRTSFADLERMPDDGARYELYDGEAVVVPAPLPRHQDIVFRIAKMLDAYATEHGGKVFISPLDIVFSDYDVLQPDVLFFQASRQHLIDLDTPATHTPDIVIEVLSAGTRARDRGAKMEMYARYGVDEYWLVAPGDRSIEIYRLEGRRFVLAQTSGITETVRSIVLPDLQVSVESLF